MAEGWTRHLGGGRVVAISAGIESHGKNPHAIAVMREAGVDISRQESTILTGEMLAAADILVTVCGHADEHCPVIPEGMRKEYWPLSDPAKARGSEKDVIAVYEESRDDIRKRVADLIARISS